VAYCHYERQFKAQEASHNSKQIIDLHVQTRQKAVPGLKKVTERSSFAAEFRVTQLHLPSTF
jgi:hypothetical protein